MKMFVCIIICFAAICMGAKIYDLLIKKAESETFYDGEGNEIPNSAVHLLVKSQFTTITQRQRDTLDFYFYYNNR